MNCLKRLWLQDVLGSASSQAGFVTERMSCLVPCLLLKAAHADVLRRRGMGKSAAREQARRELAQVAAMLGAHPALSLSTDIPDFI